MRNLITIVLILAVLALGTLAWDLNLDLDRAQRALAIKPAQTVPLCEPCQCACPEPPACPAIQEPGPPARRITTQHYSIESLARACVEGRLQHNGRIGILEGN